MRGRSFTFTVVAIVAALLSIVREGSMTSTIATGLLICIQLDVSMNVGAWPWSLLNVLSVTVWVAAVVTAWLSADRVIRKNRPWTRAWRMMVACAAFAFDGIWFPVGAVFVLVKWRGSRPAAEWT